MENHWGNLVDKVDRMPLRERVMIFAAATTVLVALAKSLMLDPLLVEKNKKYTQLQQKQESLKSIQAQMESVLKAKKDVESSPLRKRLELARQQLSDGGDYLHGLHNHLVEPEKMGELLERVLKQNSGLQLVNLQTLPVAPLDEKMVAKQVGTSDTSASGVQEVTEKQAFKHGVQISVRGNYMDLLQYLTALEHLPTQMFWGNAEMKVEQYPAVMLTLTLYTLSLEKTWLKI